MEIRDFLANDYQRIKSLLMDGGLFLQVQNEEKAIQNAVNHLEQASRQLMEQQQRQIDQKFHIKTSTISGLLSKLKMAGNNIGALSKDDLKRLETALEEMLQILDLQRKHELADSEADIEAKKDANIASYKSRVEPAMERHYEDAQCKVDEIKCQLALLEDYYETASFDSEIWHDLQTKSGFPKCNSIKLGDTIVHLSESGGREIRPYKIPEIVPFFARKSITITYKSSERSVLKNMIDGVIARTLMSADAGNVQFYFMDAVNNGALFFDYLKCAPKVLELFNGKLFVLSSEIESTLMKIQDDYNEIDQNMRKGDSVEVFNENHPKTTIPYRVVIMDSFPKAINSSMLPLISRLVKNEIEAGLHFVFLMEEQDAAKQPDIVSLTTSFPIQTNLRVGIDDNLSKKVLQYVSEAYNREKTMLFEEYYDANVKWWSEMPSNFTIIPLGMQRAANYNLVFNEEGRGGGVASCAAVILGMSGCGKSCLMHSMIVGTSIKYSPNDLRFFLIDLKAVEFKMYEVEQLPHAEFVALKASPEFGLHVLRIIQGEIKNRHVLFNKKNVKNYFDYRENYPDEVLPRYMVFIDEYQEMLKGEFRQPVLEILKYIMRIGRHAGFIIILSSQLMELDSDCNNLISHRIAMRSTTAAARMVLNFYDERAPQLNTGQAIIHSTTTDLVQSYYLPDSQNGKPSNAEKIRADYLRLIRERWNERTNGQYEHNMVVFDVEKPALLSNNRTFKKMSVINDLTEVRFSPGEKYMVDGTDFMCKFTRIKNENLLVLGGQANVSVRVMDGCLMSLLPQLDPEQVEIDIVNMLNLSQAELLEEVGKTSDYIDKKFKKATYSTSEGEVDALLDGIIANMELRAKSLNSGSYVAPRFLVIYRADNNKAFHEVETTNGYMNITEKSAMANKLVQILTNGPEVGIHCMVHFNDPAAYYQVLDGNANDKHFFNHRVLLQMQESDSAHFLDSYSMKDASNLVDKEASEEFAYNLALYYNAYDLTDPVKIKPYDFYNNK